MNSSQRADAERECEAYVRLRFGGVARGYQPDGFSVPMGSGAADTASCRDVASAQKIEELLLKVKHVGRRRRLVRLLKHVHLHGRKLGEFELFEPVAQQLSRGSTVPTGAELVAAGCKPTEVGAPTGEQKLEDARAMRESTARNHLRLGLQELGNADRWLEGLVWLMLSDFYRVVCGG